jgi:1,4-alpha-glucan branching enzyme
MRFGVSKGGAYREIINTDGSDYGGSGYFTDKLVQTEDQSWHDMPLSLRINVPPLATLMLVCDA